MQKIFILGLALTAMSCTKVIDVDLDNSSPQTVIESNLKEGVDSLRITITKTEDYFDESMPTGVSGAVVNLVDENGLRLNAQMAAPGTYWIDSVNAVSGKYYSLEVESDGKFTSATSYLPPVVPIDSLKFRYDDGKGFFEEGYYTYIRFKDPPGEDNYYRIRFFVNGEEEEGIRIMDDKFTDGSNRKVEFRFLDLEPEAGDQIRIELQSIDPDVHKYYETLNDIIGGGGGGVAPGNPTTNLQGDIQLGYFGTYSSSVVQSVFP